MGLDPQVEEQLRTWWMETAAMDFEGFISKAKEYGSRDLDIMGECMQGLTPGRMTPGEAREMAICFYALGKISRAFSAYERGDTPSEDTLHDLTVYSMMARWERYFEAVGLRTPPQGAGRKDNGGVHDQSSLESDSEPITGHGV